jgi:hypothetical protein
MARNEWRPNPKRENGKEKKETLFLLFLDFGFKYSIAL